MEIFKTICQIMLLAIAIGAVFFGISALVTYFVTRKRAVTIEDMLPEFIKYKNWLIEEEHYHLVPEVLGIIKSLKEGKRPKELKNYKIEYVENTVYIRRGELIMPDTVKTINLTRIVKI